MLSKEDWRRLLDRCESIDPLELSTLFADVG